MGGNNKKKRIYIKNNTVIFYGFAKGACRWKWVRFRGGEKRRTRWTARNITGLALYGQFSESYNFSAYFIINTIVFFYFFLFFMNIPYTKNTPGRFRPTPDTTHAPSADFIDRLAKYITRWMLRFANVSPLGRLKFDNENKQLRLNGLYSSCEFICRCFPSILRRQPE